ncbi:MAG: class I SAM-dependent methyltransferase [Planctomycetes bacterium]|nr:class I SAM-dependent methyltransferase [Planctomycetota bacterium]
MFEKIKKKLLSRFCANENRMSLKWIKRQRGTWLCENLGSRKRFIPPYNPLMNKIEEQAASTNNRGDLPVWDGYQQAGITRTSNQVRTSYIMGRFFSWLCQKKKPSIIVEFGTAFGVSGMYWLAGLELNKNGRLLTFEPNEQWAKIAKANMESISNRFDLTVGTFEENIDFVLNDQKIDMAFIDAIHSGEFVLPQFKLVMERSSKKAIVVFDDIDYSEDMKDCWNTIANSDQAAASLEVTDRVGIVELY